MKTLALSVTAFLTITLSVAGRCSAQSNTDPGTGLIPANTDVFVPDAFSPNGDGLNDKFVPVFSGSKTYTVNSFRVFNRGGQEVFNGGRNTTGWDGTFKGQPAESATYSYHLLVFDTEGKEKTVTGYVALIR